MKQEEQPKQEVNDRISEAVNRLLKQEAKIAYDAYIDSYENVAELIRKEYQRELLIRRDQYIQNQRFTDPQIEGIIQGLQQAIDLLQDSLIKKGRDN